MYNMVMLNKALICAFINTNTNTNVLVFSAEQST